MKYSSKLVMSSALVGLAFMGINTSASAQFGGGGGGGDRGGGVSAGVSAGSDGVSASVGVGGSSRSVGTGGSSGGGISADASIGGGGADVDANVGGSGGLSADANVGDGGADANVRLGGAGTGTTATGDVDLNGTDGNNVVLTIGDNGLLQRQVRADATLLGGDQTNAAVNADSLDDVTATANVLSSAAADVSITGTEDDATPGVDEGIPGEDGVAGMDPDAIRNQLSSMSESEIAALKQKCPDVLASPASADPDAVAVCEVVASL